LGAESRRDDVLIAATRRFASACWCGGPWPDHWCAAVRTRVGNTLHVCLSRGAGRGLQTAAVCSGVGGCLGRPLLCHPCSLLLQQHSARQTRREVVLLRPAGVLWVPAKRGVISGRARVVSKSAPCPGALSLLSWVQETARSGEAAMKLACARESCNCHVASAVACRCVGRGALRVPLRAHGASHVLALTLAHARTCRNMARRWGASQTPLVRAARGLWSTTPEARRVDGVAHRTLAVLQVPLSLAHGTRARVVVCVLLRAPQWWFGIVLR
jgi:hypothetical protein